MPIEQTSSFQYNGATITVRPRTGRDIIHLRMLNQKLVPALDAPDHLFWLNVLGSYAKIITQTVDIDGALDFRPASIMDSPDELRANAEQLLALPGKLLLAWEDACVLADMPANDPDLLPPEDLDDSQKKAPPSKKSGSSSAAE